MLITPVYRYSPPVIHRCIDAIVNSTYCVLYQDILTQQLYALCWCVMPVLQSNAINELVLWIKVLCFFHESVPKPKTTLNCSKMTSSNGNIFRVIGPLCGEFTGHPGIPLTKASDAGLWCFLLICALHKQSWGRWFETPSLSLWRHRNAKCVYP